MKTKHTSIHLYSQSKINSTLDKYVRSTALRNTKPNIAQSSPAKTKGACDISEQPIAAAEDTKSIRDFTDIARSSIMHENQILLNSLTSDDIEQFFTKLPPTQTQICIGYALYKLLNRAFHTKIYDDEMDWESISRHSRINSNEIIALLQMIPSIAEGSTSSNDILKIKRKYLSGSDVRAFIHNSNTEGNIGKLVVHLISLYEAQPELKCDKQINKSLDIGRQLMSKR